jgi:predicted nucleic acid-binding protein
VKAILIDSDILIEVSRARGAAILASWDDLSRSDVLLLCSPVTVAEIWHGASEREHPASDALFAALTCVPIDAQIGRHAGEYLRLYAKSHAVELGHALIAAAASIHGRTLWTRNRKHYPMKELSFY